MPVAAALNFYRQLAHHLDFDPDRQVTWLIDSQQRLVQYGELAKALGRPLRIALEIDVGLERGGFTTPQALAQALLQLRQQPALHLQGLMAYDAHVAHSPPWQNQLRAFSEADERYRLFISSAQGFSDLWPAKPLLNGAGSLTYLLHSQQETSLNDCLLYTSPSPRD